MENLTDHKEEFVKRLLCLEVLEPSAIPDANRKKVANIAEL